jgi:hypothetical protein
MTRLLHPLFRARSRCFSALCLPGLLWFFTNAASAVEEGLIAHWKFDEATGTIALDSSSNTNHASIVGAAYVPGQFETALAFDGLKDHAFASDATSGGTTAAGLDTGTRDWTVSAWIKTTGSGMLVTKMGFFGGSNPDGWGVSISGNGTVGAHIRKLGAGEVNIFNGDGKTVNDGEWRHIAVIFNRGGNMVRYVDGAATGTANNISGLMGQSINNTHQFRIAARDVAGNEIFFKGSIDDVRVYARALSAGEIAAQAGREPPDPDPDPPAWSNPLSLVPSHGRVAIGNRVHVVGHSGGNLVHRSSQDHGATWSAPTIIAPASGNFPMQYGGLFAQGDSVYLLTAAGDMGTSSQHLDFRRSNNNGAAWASPVRVTGPGQQLRRANITAHGENVHVFGGQSGEGGYGTGIYYFRSRNGGVTWDKKIMLYAEADASARLAVDGEILHVAFGAKRSPNSFGGRTHYIRSVDNGETWSEPVFIGEESAESSVQARQQIAVVDGRVFAVWQREGDFPGAPLPPDRLGFNRSEDGGATWVGAGILPGDRGIDRNHQQVWMTPGGGVHLA